MAAYVEAGKRIPRRGEIGLTSDEILTFEGIHLQARQKAVAPGVVGPAVTGASLPRRCAGVSFSLHGSYWRRVEEEDWDGGNERREGKEGEEGERGGSKFFSPACMLVTLSISLELLAH